MNRKMERRTTEDQIDIVISWVDGNDPDHKRKIDAYRSGQKYSKADDVAGKTRFANNGEINFCVASINRYADFVRQIFIITDGQDPCLDEFINKHFDNPVPVRIIDHKTIFEGYEEYLPTFNSRAIEALLWRIPGLSERFVYMNDDFLLTAPCTLDDFFIGENTVCYADWYSTLFARTLRWIKPKKKGHKPIGFKDSMLNALDIIGSGPKFLYLAHSPRALRKSFYEDFFKEHEDVLIRNIRHKFRHAEQYNSQELFYMTEYRNGRCVVRSPKQYGMYLKPKKRKNYIADKLESFRRKPHALFCCFNSLDQASADDRNMVNDWIMDRLSL